MRYKQRIIKHNIDVPKNIPSDTIELNEIKYDPSVVSHHPKSFEYYFTHGILINDERYIIKEFYVKNEDVYAVVTKDEIKYFELRMNYCSKPVLDKILKDLEKVKNSVENNKPVLTGRTLTINGSSVELPDDKQELSIRDHKLILSKGNSVDLPEYDDSEVKNRLNTLETREDNDKQTLSINERTVSISNGNSIELPEDKDTVYDDTNIKRRLQTLETKPDKDSQTLSLDGRTLSISDGNYVTLPEDRDTVYNDSELIRRLNALENKTDKFVSGASVTREGNKIVITYTFSTGENKAIEFEDHDTLGVAYDDTAIIERIKALETKPDNDTIYDDSEVKNRLTRLESKKDNDTIYNDSELRGKIEGLSSRETAVESRVSQLEKRPVASNYDDSSVLRRLNTLEARPDNDRQTLSLNSSTGVLSISGGNSVTIPKDNQPILRIAKNNIPGYAVPGSVNTTDITNFLNSSGIKGGDIVQDIKYYPNNGATEINYWNVSYINGSNITLTFANKKVFGNKILSEPTHRVYYGDIPGFGNPKDTATIKKFNILNPEGIKVGDTIEDFSTDVNYVNRGVWKVIEVNNDDVKVQGLISQIHTFNNFARKSDYDKLKGAFDKLLTDLKNSGAWKQTGPTLYDGELYSNRHIATGNINIFGGTPDGNSFIRTSNNKTENDLAGG